jgi:phosphatidylglycerophosphatase A
MDEAPKNSKNIPAGAWTHPAVILATGFWLGRSPIMPGTVGAILGLPLAWAINSIPSLAIQIAIIIAICLLGIPICTIAARRLGNLKDPGCIVLDEIASLPITFFLVPVAAFERPWVVVAGFVLHRIIDITKPPPAPQLERLPEGLGIMADDWSAGVYSCLLLHAILWAGWI